MTDSQYSEQHPVVPRGQIQQIGDSAQSVEEFSLEELSSLSVRPKVRRVLCITRTQPDGVRGGPLETNLCDGLLRSFGLVVAAELRHPLDMVAAHRGI